MKKNKKSKLMNKMKEMSYGGMQGFSNALPVGDYNPQFNMGGFFGQNNPSMNIPYSVPQMINQGGAESWYNPQHLAQGGFFSNNNAGMRMPYAYPQLDNFTNMAPMYTGHLANGGFFAQNNPSMNMPQSFPQTINQSGAEQWYTPEHLMYGGYPMENHSLQHCDDGGQPIIENNDYEMKSGGWIKKAVNPAHKGFCSPMTKKTCTPKRKALAKTFKKHHGFHKKANGGIIDSKMIGNEEYYLVED